MVFFPQLLQVFGQFRLGTTGNPEQHLVELAQYEFTEVG